MDLQVNVVQLEVELVTLPIQIQPTIQHTQIPPTQTVRIHLSVFLTWDLPVTLYQMSAVRLEVEQ